VTVAALQALLDEELPDVVRHPAPWIPHTAHRRQEMTMSQPIPAPHRPQPPKAELRTVPPAPTSPAFTAALQAESLPVGKLLAWAAEHDDKAVRKHAEQARESLAALRDRHSSDAELIAIEREASELKARMAELHKRREELQPKKGGKRTSAPRDHDPAVVRAWATAQGIEVAPLGRVPGSIVDRWREAQQGGGA
jgi:hypothetical protein